MEGKDLAAIYRTMLRIRRFDQGVADLFKEGLVKGTAHSYVGQEAVAAGACAALTPADFVVSDAGDGPMAVIVQKARMGPILAAARVP